MDEDLLAGDAPREERDNLFAWTVLILLLIGFALASWLGTYYVFGHPENPRSYRLLQKLKKIEAPKRFEVTEAPPGEFLPARKLYEKYIIYTRLRLQDENDELLRLYINNYQETKRLVPYVVGRYTILASRALNEGDIFASGAVALAQSVDYPSVLIEYLYPAAPETVPQLEKMLAPGVTLELKRTIDLSAVLHIESVEGRLQITLVPLLYGTYALKQGEGSFSLDPPPGLNVAAGMPVVKADEMQEAVRVYASNETPEQKLAASSAAASPPGAAELVRVDSNPPPGVSVAVAAPVSSPSRIQPRRAAPPEAAPPEEPAATPPPESVAMNATPAPPAVEAATPEVVSTPMPVLSPDGVPLQPFLVAKTAPTLPSSEAAHWTTYSPGQMPRGRLVETDELPELADRTVGGERLYIRGQFVVTASEENRAVLRLRGSLGNALTRMVRSGAGSPRIIVEFPAGAVPPAEGSNLARDESRPFQIIDVRRGADGEINVYAREVTQPP